MKSILVICGPTGIGKTGFAIDLARLFDGEIIGADSLQIYQHLNIGTAKPDAAERAAVPHHLVDFADPKEAFDAGKYVDLADKAIETVCANDKLPIVAGGTGLYIKALLHGLFRSKPVCEKTMAALTLQLEEKGADHLHQQLLSVDPDAAKKIHPNDTFRVLRALEVYHTTGMPISHRQGTHEFKTRRYRYLKIGLFMERKVLYDRINERVEQMLNAGLLDETLQLIQNGYGFDLKPMQSIGYKHMDLFLNQGVEWAEVVRLMKRDTRRYAKRQFTWFNQDTEIHWLKPNETGRAADLVKEFLT